MIPVAQFSGFGSCEINRADTVKALFGLIHRTQEAMGRARILQWHPTPKLGSSMMPICTPSAATRPIWHAAQGWRRHDEIAIVIVIGRPALLHPSHPSIHDVLTHTFHGNFPLDRQSRRHLQSHRNAGPSSATRSSLPGGRTGDMPMRRWTGKGKLISVLRMSHLRSLGLHLRQKGRPVRLNGKIQDEPLLAGQHRNLDRMHTTPTHCNTREPQFAHFLGPLSQRTSDAPNHGRPAVMHRRPTADNAMHSQAALKRAMKTRATPLHPQRLTLGLAGGSRVEPRLMAVRT
ncbi:hypothetical protein V495_08463 [Pseudogymnoascus sp. VKM F-4514 (FW-929)]|nr:hypothetical protein V495_08463 [Pseudogymnoascus sp. VKM F-4514 (FW-929)]KFY52148.1 hypothetical protein V497_08617 [Pseudogymnoascus sp. VKM F-4516 (FW-969)]